MKRNRFLLLVYVSITFLSNQSFAQDTGTKPLGDFLHVLEEKFDVVFTYADENIRGVTVIIPQNEWSLEENIQELQKQTGLEFTKINSRYIAIHKNKNGVTISGIIIDQSTKEILEGAVVASNNAHAISDKQGQFSIKIKTETDSILDIRYVGYKNKLVTIDGIQHGKLTIELIPDVLLLEEVVVDYIAKGINKLVDGTIQLNVRNLEVLPGLAEPDVLHAIQVLPGMKSINETVSDINTRGGTNDQNLVLWDGVKMYQTGHFFGLISAFNSHLIHKTKVIKNGTSAVWGEGVSGIIEMQLQDYMVSSFELDAGINMVSTDANVKIPIHEKLSVILGARNSINNLVVTPTYKSYFVRAFKHTEVAQQNYGSDTIINNYRNFSFYDFCGKLLYDISEKDKIRLSFLNIKNEIEYEESVFVLDTLFRKMSHLNQASILSNFNYSHLWSTNQAIQLSAFISNYRLEGTNVELLNGQHHYQQNEVIDWGIKLDSKNKINRIIALLSGYQFNEIGVRNLDNIQKPDYERDVKDVLRIHTLYSEVELKKLFEKLYFRFGIRANFFSEFNKFILEPRAVINFKLNKYISLELIGESKSQHTTQLIDYQTDFFGVEKRRWTLANNESIPIIKSRQLSTGVHFSHAHFLISIEGYMKMVTGVVTPSQGFQNQFQYVYSDGKYHSQGVEVLINKRFKHFNIWSNYSLAKSDYYFPDLIPPSFPNNFDITHTLSLGGSCNIKKIEVSTGFNYRTGKPYTKPLDENTGNLNEIAYEEPNSSRLDDYIRLDLSAKYNFNFKQVKGEFGMSVWNILNHDNIINIYYQKNDNNEIEKITQKALKITPNVNLRLRF